MLDYGFYDLGFHKINGVCMSINAASRRVMEKLGMKYEGTLRQDLYKDGIFYDLDRLSILKDEYYTIRKVENWVFNTSMLRKLITDLQNVKYERNITEKYGLIF